MNFINIVRKFEDEKSNCEHVYFILFLTINSYADVIFMKDYSKLDNVKVNGVLTAKKNDSTCGGYLFVDKVVSFEYHKGVLLINTKNEHEFDINYEIGTVDFDYSKDLMELLKSKEDIVFIGDRCGAKGGIFDIHSLIKLKVIK